MIQLNAAYEGNKINGEGGKITTFDKEKISRLHLEIDARAVAVSKTKLIEEKSKESSKGKNEGTKKKKRSFWTRLKPKFWKKPKVSKTVKPDK